MGKHGLSGKQAVDLMVNLVVALAHIPSTEGFLTLATSA
jgi:hypothetical protein